MSSAPGGDTYVEGPRHAVITPDNEGPVITIITLFLMVVMILAVALRLLVRFTTSRVPGYDDAVVSIALVIALGEVISTCVTVNHGLGTRRVLIPDSQWIQVEKGLFASALLYLLTIAMAKASTLLLLYRLTVSRKHKLVVRVLAAITGAWALAAIFALSFGCSLPHVWDISSDSCDNMIAYWTAIGIIDILLDVSLILMPTWLVWNLQMPFRRKAFVIFGFAFRIVLINAQIARLVYLNRFDSTNTNGVQDTLGYILATQFETLFSVVVACVPAYRPFMEAAASGLMGISFRDRKGTYELSAVDNANNASKQSSGKQNSPNASRSRSKAHIFDPEGGADVAIAAASRKNSKAVAPPENGYVQKTVEWDVQFSDQAMLTGRPTGMGIRDDSTEIPPGTSSTTRFEKDLL